jgi:fused signal recognition particle receptor
VLTQKPKRRSAGYFDSFRCLMSGAPRAVVQAEQHDARINVTRCPNLPGVRRGGYAAVTGRVPNLEESPTVTQLQEFLAVAAVLALAGIALVVGLVRGHSRSGKADTLPRLTTPPRVDGGAEPDVGDSLAGPAIGPTVDTAESEILEEPPRAPSIERPQSAAGRLQRLRARLVRSNTALGKGLLSLLSSGGLDEQAWEDVEDTLLSSDLGVEATMELVESLRTRVTVEGARDEEAVRGWLREDLLRLVDPSLDRSIASSRVDGRPAVVLVVGVNGTGKTTTIGKLARVLVAEDKDVLLGAADTFRAAAADQLQTWGERVGVPTIRSDRDGADPAAVAFDAVKAAIELEADVVLIDTAGRLHNKVGLMDELGKLKRVVEKQCPIDEVLLVLDATTGQNGLRQAEVFADVVSVTGIVLTKLDGTAKGGIVVAVQRKLGVPVKLVGLGEGPDDLAPFDPEAFVDALVS